MTQCFPGVFDAVENLATEACDANRVLRREAARGVWKDGVAREIEVIEERTALRVDQAFASNRDGDDIATACVKRVLHRVVVGILSRADHEATLEDEVADPKRGESEGVGRG